MGDKVHFMGNANRGPRGGLLYVFRCPGCKFSHPFEIECSDGSGWTWNQSVEEPTFIPSLMCNRGTDKQCHLYLKNGKIEFLGDCWHELAGQTVECPDWDDDPTPEATKDPLDITIRVQSVPQWGPFRASGYKAWVEGREDEAEYGMTSQRVISRLIGSLPPSVNTERRITIISVGDPFKITEG